MFITVWNASITEYLKQILKLNSILQSFNRHSVYQLQDLEQTIIEYR